MKISRAFDPHSIRNIWWIGLLSLTVLLAGCAAVSETQRPAAPRTPDESALQQTPRRFAGLSPVAPQPADAALKPGLAIHFHRNYNSRSLNALTGGFLQDKAGISGAPIPQVNHEFERDAALYDSGRSRFLGVRMQGLLHLPESGTYTLRALVNDGVRIYIADTMIIEDPGFGADRYALPAEVSITEPGWYALKIEYFQRQGSAVLKLLWRTPSSDTFAVIPEKAFAHTGSEFAAVNP
jgi:hypothetical protein